MNTKWIFAAAISMLIAIPMISTSQLLPGTRWESLGPEGGYLTGLAQNPETGDLFASTYSNPSQIFKSTNGGDSWTLLASVPNGVEHLEIDPNQPGVLYAAPSYLGYGAGVGMYKSTNGGVTWSHLTFELTGDIGYYANHLVVDRTTPNKLAIAGYLYEWTGTTTRYCSYFAQSLNGGDNWTITRLDKLTTNEFYAMCLETDPSDSRIKYIGGYEVTSSAYVGRVFRTMNDGGTWTDITGSTLSGYVYDILVDRSSPSQVYAVTYSGVFRSADRGTTWLRNTGSAWGDRIAADPRNPSTMFAYGSGVFCNRTTDGGVTWASVASGLSGGEINQVIVDRSTSSTILAVTRSGFFRSTNGGTSWSASNKGMLCTYVPSIKCAPSSSASVYISVMYSGLFKSTNALGKGSPAAPAAVLWEKLPEYSYCEGILRMEVSPAVQNKIYIQEGST